MGDGAGAGDRARVGQSTLAMVRALHAELAGSLCVVSWYDDGDRGVLYACDEIDAFDGRLERALDRRSVADGRLEYAIDAYEEVVVVTLSSGAIPSPAGSSSGIAGIVLAVERSAPIGELTAAIERAVAVSER